MLRRDFVSTLGRFSLAAPFAGLALGLPACGPSTGEVSRYTRTDEDADAVDPLRLGEDEWRRILTPEEYHILREEGTEPPHSSPLNAEHRPGTFVCAGCFLPLFSSGTKFESGTGWPSFTRPLQGRVGTKSDYRLVVPRTEYHCARCGGHQGHVFDDGPPPTGQRWCNNGLALDFVPEGEPLPELRGAEG